MVPSKGFITGFVLLILLSSCKDISETACLLGYCPPPLPKPTAAPTPRPAPKLVKNVSIKAPNPSDESLRHWYQKENGIILKQDGFLELAAIVQMTDGTQNGNVTWSSSDSTILNVSSSGKVTGRKMGGATAIATATLDSNIRGKLNIEIVDNANFSPESKRQAKSIKITPPADIALRKLVGLNNSNAISLSLNDTVQLKANVVLTDNTLNSNVSWDSTDKNVASVSSTGLVTALKKGSATIRARFKPNPGTVVGSMNIVVDQPELLE